MKNPTVLLIDLSALFHPSWRASEHEPMSTAYESTIGGVNRAVGLMPEGTLVAICCDGPNNWRKAVSVDYKANRDKLPDLFFREFAKTKNALHDRGFLLWEYDTYEADDVIATAVKEAVGREHAVTIATHDKDLYALVSSNVDVLSLSTWEFRKVADVKAKFGIEPHQMADFLALTGDASDNVPGCPSCGPKNAAKLLNSMSLESILTANESELAPIVGPSLAGKLVAHRVQIRESRKLVALRTDVPLMFDRIYEKREAKEIAPVRDVAQEVLETGLVAQLGAQVGNVLETASNQLGDTCALVVPQLGSQKNIDEQAFYGFSGAGVAAFPDAARAVLSEPVNENDVEIREDGVVFMSGTFYRRQLTRAFGQGGWALLPRARPLAADGLVVWHGALVCLGRFVSEAFGEHDYNPKNPQASYPTSCEAAKTDCLRRCVKDLGWAGELWSKAWTEAWKKKHAETYIGQYGKMAGKTCWRKKK